MKAYGSKAGDDVLSINLKLHTSKAELINTLKHELIHYELENSKKEYHGHGQAFLKRAKQLNILGSIELSQCSGVEEAEQTPRRVEHIKTPLPDVAAGIEKELATQGTRHQAPDQI